MISFDTSADLCPKAYFDPINKIRLKLELQFGSTLTQAVNIIVYAEFNNLIEINGNRDVIHNLLNEKWTVKIMLKNCVNIFMKTKFLLSFFVSLFFSETLRRPIQKLAAWVR